MPIDLQIIEDQIVALSRDEIDLEELTQANLENGTGVFDVLMRALEEHLQKEHSADRITGDQYANAYVQLTSTVLTQSIQFLLGAEKLKLDRGLTLLQLAKLEKEIALLCQKLVTEKAQVMDRTILDPTATEDTSYTNAAGDSYHNTIQEVEGTIGERNNVLARQVQGYDDNYKTQVGKIILDTYRTVVSNLGSDSGVSFPPSIIDAGTEYLMKTLKMDSGLQAVDNTNNLGRDDEGEYYWNLDPNVDSNVDP